MYENKESLNQKIEAIYDMFAKYSPEANITLCSCCSTKEDQLNLNRILENSLKNLNDNDLWEYESAWAINGGLKVETAKHFIPWYMERVLSLEDYILPETALDFLKKIDKNDLEKEEIKLLESSLLALCEYCLNLHPNEGMNSYYLTNVDELIIMCGYFNLEKVLDLWLNQSNHTALLHFKNFIYSGFKNKNKVLTEWLSNPNTIKVFIEKIENIILFKSEEVLEKDLEELNLFYEVIAMKDF